jgi:hypothetical protein|tara:strand:- start:1356 stop:1592 length:237 start_codon:yes stop_codon:yes gene_type:complete
MTIHRICFDFTSAEGAADFWEQFQALNPDWNDTHLVHKDTLHDRGKGVKEYMVRHATPDNGRPVTITRTPYDETVAIK